MRCIPIYLGLQCKLLHFTDALCALKQILGKHSSNTVATRIMKSTLKVRNPHAVFMTCRYNRVHGEVKITCSCSTIIINPRACAGGLL